MPLKGQHQDGSMDLLSYERQDCVFSEDLRRRAYNLLGSRVSEERVFDTKAELSKIIVYYALQDKDPHQSIYFLTKMHNDYPTVANPLYDDLVGIAWWTSIDNEELGQRMLGAAGVRYE